MTSQEIRDSFLAFFREKTHHVVPSAPMVLKNDPTLMFTNAGMNQFKDYFLGNKEADKKRVTDTQKCLRVTGKHNDLEEVGHDTYHHTMFEMLGNWSFGDYFKKEAIAWAWEFLTERVKLSPDRIYATIFEGDEKEGIEKDTEAHGHWKHFLPPYRILEGSKKDNFWEMGDTGPCGPCSEIHLDLRSESDRKKVSGVDLVNRNHPLVIEIWNLVFIQFNRKADGTLEPLPEKHVDTGMGFERLCMAIQGKTSNYDTDLFQPIIGKMATLTGQAYGKDPSADIAMRVVADHLRAISFSIADGQLPSNNKAGYVIRRILRRAVRYGFTYLNQKEPFIYTLVPALVQAMGDAFPELAAQQELITKVIREEEQSFLFTLETGMKLLDQLTDKAQSEDRTVIAGRDAFVLYDTYGFPLDLTELILSERNMNVDREGFQQEMAAQKTRSKKAAETESGDWVVVRGDQGAASDVEAVGDREDAQAREREDAQAGDREDAQARDPEDAKAGKAETLPDGFVGYDQLSARVKITRYRKVVSKKKEQYQLVFNITPFYAESGGQVGDQGFIESDKERVEILDTIKENELIIHLAKKLPSDPSAEFTARVNEGRRMNTARAHTATHLMHHALREILGEHVEQKGSLVEANYLRFDFSHFQKVTDEELRKVEHRVNQMIRANTVVDEHRSVPMGRAEEMGAIALFGEKYGESVRVIKFGASVELCGGTHVTATGQIGTFRVFRETGIAAGVRRIEAFTGETAERYIDEHMDMVKQIAGSFEKQQDLVKAVKGLVSQNSQLAKQVERFQQNMLGIIARNLEGKVEMVGGYSLAVSRVEVDEPNHLRDLSFRLRSRYPRLNLVLGAEINGKAHLAVMLADLTLEEHELNASEMIKQVASHIQGGGGGQPFFATAGGKNPEGLDKALEEARKILVEELGGE